MQKKKDADIKASPEMLTCAKTLVGLIANFDPFGIAAAAKAFIFNRCDKINFA